MKFKVSESQIDATIWWIWIQMGILAFYYAFHFWNQGAICNDLENYLSNQTNWIPPADNPAG